MLVIDSKMYVSWSKDTDIKSLFFRKVKFFKNNCLILFVFTTEDKKSTETYQSI